MCSARAARRALPFGDARNTTFWVPRPPDWDLLRVSGMRSCCYVARLMIYRDLSKYAIIARLEAGMHRMQLYACSAFVCAHSAATTRHYRHAELASAPRRSLTHLPVSPAASFE